MGSWLSVKTVNIIKIGQSLQEQSKSTQESKVKRNTAWNHVIHWADCEHMYVDAQ